MVSNSSQNNSHTYTSDNDRKFQYYYLQKVTHNESFTPTIIPTQTKTRDELQKKFKDEPEVYNVKTLTNQL